jgi:hypothetical protein
VEVGAEQAVEKSWCVGLPATSPACARCFRVRRRPIGSERQGQPPRLTAFAERPTPRALQVQSDLRKGLSTDHFASWGSPWGRGGPRMRSAHHSWEEIASLPLGTLRMGGAMFHVEQTRTQTSPLPFGPCPRRGRLHEGSVDHAANWQHPSDSAPGPRATAWSKWALVPVPSVDRGDGRSFRCLISATCSAPSPPLPPAEPSLSRHNLEKPRFAIDLNHTSRQNGPCRAYYIEVG